MFLCLLLFPLYFWSHHRFASQLLLFIQSRPRWVTKNLILFYQWTRLLFKIIKIVSTTNLKCWWKCNYWGVGRRHLTSPREARAMFLADHFSTWCVRGANAMFSNYPKPWSERDTYNTVQIIPVWNSYIKTLVLYTFNMYTKSSMYQ